MYLTYISVIITTIVGITAILTFIFKIGRSIYYEVKGIKIVNYTISSFFSNARNGTYGNFLKIGLNIKNNKIKESVVTKVIVEDIQLEKHYFSDIFFDACFVNDTESFRLFACNNGNQKGLTGIVNIRVFGKDNFDSDELKLLLELDTQDNEVESGFIKEVSNISFQKYTSLFKNFRVFDIKITVGDASRKFMGILYDPSKNKYSFNPSFGSIGGDARYPFFNLQENSIRLEKKADFLLKRNEHGKVYFYLFVDGNYKVTFTPVIEVETKILRYTKKIEFIAKKNIFNVSGDIIFILGPVSYSILLDKRKELRLEDIEDRYDNILYKKDKKYYEENFSDEYFY